MTRDEERREAALWAEGRKPPRVLTPAWDRDPDRHHLALDGGTVADLPPGSCAVLEADAEELHHRLTFASTRSGSPWQGIYRIKTARTAYRWSRGLPVTPPLLKLHGSEIHIVGGMHRFHLAKRHAARIEFLVRCDEVEALRAMLPSATILQPCSPPRADEGVEQDPDGQ